MYACEIRDAAPLAAVVLVSDAEAIHALVDALTPVTADALNRTEAPLRAPEHPRWEHEFTFPATTRQLRAARRRVAASVVVVTAALWAAPPAA